MAVADLLRVKIEQAQQRLTNLKEEPESLISTSDLTTQDAAHAQAYKLWIGRKKAFKTLLGPSFASFSSQLM